MRKKIIIPAIMAISAVGSVLTGSTVTMAATSAPAVVAAAPAHAHAHPGLVFDG